MRRRSEVIDLARSYLGTRWLHQGRSRGGIDCAGLVIVVGNELGLIDYDTTDYQRRTTGPEFMYHFKMNLETKRLADAQPGDVMLFRDKQFPCHSVILGEKKGRLTLIHAIVTRRMVVEEPLEQGDWISRRTNCFSYPGVEAWPS